MDVHPHTSAHAHLLRQVPGGFRARSLHFNSVSNSMVAGPSKVSGVMRTKTRWHFCVGRVPLYLSMDLLLNRVGGQRSEAHAAVSVPFGAGSREEPLLAARELESSSPQLGQRHGFCQPAGLFPPGVAADWSLFLAQGPTWVGGAARQLARLLAWP